MSRLRFLRALQLLALWLGSTWHFGAPSHAQQAEEIRAGTAKIVVTAPAARTGAGIVVSRDAEEAYIVTAAHVVNDAEKIFVEFYRAGGRWTAEVKNVEFDNIAKGFALLRVSGNLPTRVKTLPLATDGTVVGGEQVSMIGHQASTGDWGLLLGTVSRRRGRDIVIQAPIREQTSGGPVILGGRVVGLVQGKDPSEAFGYAVTAQAIREYVEGLQVGLAVPPPTASPPAERTPSSYPEKPVTMVVPFAAGGATDILARALGSKLSAALSRPFPIENKPGASGAIGAEQVKRAAPDGYTLLVASIGVYATNPFLLRNLPYDPAKDFDLLTVAVREPIVLVVHPSISAKDVSAFVQYLKKGANKVGFASSGAGSLSHLTAVLFFQKVGVNGEHVPYKGAGPALSDLLAGQVQASFQNAGALLSHIKAGKLKALAVTGDKRSALLPDVPTLTEAGVRGVEVYAWQAVAAPRGLPREVKNKLHSSLAAALNEQDLKQKLSEQGLEIVANSPDQAAQFLNQELARWKAVIAVGGIKLD